MPDDKTSAPKAAKAPLARASESGLPDVQYLIANRRSLEMAGDDEGCAAIDKQLAELGFE